MKKELKSKQSSGDMKHFLDITKEQYNMFSSNGSSNNIQLNDSLEQLLKDIENVSYSQSNNPQNNVNLEDVSFLIQNDDSNTQRLVKKIQELDDDAQQYYKKYQKWKEEYKSLKKAYDILCKEVIKLELTNHQLVPQYNSLLGDYKRSQEKLSTYKEQNQQLQQQNDEKEAYIQALEEKNQKLKLALHQSKTQPRVHNTQRQQTPTLTAQQSTQQLFVSRKQNLQTSGQNIINNIKQPVTSTPHNKQNGTSPDRRTPKVATPTNQNLRRQSNQNPNVLSQKNLPSYQTKTGTSSNKQIVTIPNSKSAKMPKPGGFSGFNIVPKPQVKGF